MVIGLQHLILKENKNKKVNLELSLGNHFISLFSKDPESTDIITPEKISKRESKQTH